MNNRTGYYLLLKDEQNPEFSADNSSWWGMLSSYVYTPDDVPPQLKYLALRGEVLVSLEEEEQPEDTNKIALHGVKQTCQHVQCNREDLKELNFEEVQLLLAVNSYFERCKIVDCGRLTWGCNLLEGTNVTVRIKDIQKDVSGILRYKGPVSPYDGTMFGVEISDHRFRRQGSCDGSIQCKRYFRCSPASGMFVSLDKLSDISSDEQASNEHVDNEKEEAILKEFKKLQVEDLNKNEACDIQRERENGQETKTNANLQHLEKKVSNESKEEMENSNKNICHGKEDGESDNNENEVLNKLDADTDGLELKLFVDELEQQLMKAKTELQEKEKKWERYSMEWEMKLGLQLVAQNDLNMKLNAMEKRLEEEERGRLEAEEMLRQEQKSWKHQRKSFNREWEEFERRLLEERTLRTKVEESLSEVQGQLEQETARKLEVQVKLEETRSECRQQEQDFVRQRQYFEYRIRELEATPGETHVSEGASEEDPRDWIISRDEIHVTEKSLGKGAWGEVVEGKFRDCPVAVKRIHDLILSPHNRRLFEREMSIASRCRHPCLLQFIGATNDDGSPLFVTELLDANLRAVLETRPLTEHEIATIAHDVAMALNYLHLNKPLPIIHRDISSANVLLWKRNSGWRAKVSDYGAANFMRQCRTINPGAVIYSAPEAFSLQQTPKIDVFSFGLLLCEMAIRELPVPNQTRRQMDLVTHQALRDLIAKCVQEDHEKRPTMSQVIQELNVNLIEGHYMSS